MANEEKDTAHGNAIGYMILACIAAALIWGIWHVFQEDIRSAVRWVRWAEMQLVALFVPEGFTIWWRGQEVNQEQVADAAALIPKEHLNRDHLSLFSAAAMQPLRIPLTLIFVAMAVWALFRGPRTQYRRTLGLEGLIERQAPNFGVIAPFKEFDPGKQPPRAPGSPVPAELPLFAEALGPEEWLAYHSIPVPDGVLDSDAAATAFALQLGPRWGGAGRLPEYKQVLLAAFCLKAVRQRGESDDLLGRLSMCWSHKDGMHLSRDRRILGDARKILRDSDLAGETLSQANQHGFETTALLRALRHARAEGGVLAPAQFLWLRGQDRTLWYPLNNLGRQSHHTEALGAMAHFRLERATQRPIPVPKMDEAVQMIAEYMESPKARPIPALDYSGSKKRGVKKAK